MVITVNYLIVIYTFTCCINIILLHFIVYRLQGSESSFSTMQTDIGPHPSGQNISLHNIYFVALGFWLQPLWAEAQDNTYIQDKNRQKIGRDTCCIIWNNTVHLHPEERTKSRGLPHVWQPGVSWDPNLVMFHALKSCWMDTTLKPNKMS